jgi:GT2 family glycosyltransferase
MKYSGGNQKMNFNSGKISDLTSVVITSYRRPEQLNRCVKSLINSSDVYMEILVWDNGSNDSETRNLLDKMETEYSGSNADFRIIRHPKNVGTAKGRQLAFQLTKGEYIFSSDDDIEFTDRCIENLIIRIKTDKRIAAVGAKLVFENDTVQWNGGLIERKHGDLAQFHFVDYGKNSSDDHLEKLMNSAFICGGATLFRKDALDLVNFNTQNFNDYTDFHLSLELLSKGFILSNCPTAKVIHHNHNPERHILHTHSQIERDYDSIRRNAENLQNSVLAFYLQHGVNLIQDAMQRLNNTFFGISLSGKSEEELDTLSKQIITAKGHDLSNVSNPHIMGGKYYFEFQKERLRNKYNLDKLEKNNVIDIIVSSYSKAFEISSIEYDNAGLKNYLLKYIEKKCNDEIDSKDLVESASHFFRPLKDDPKNLWLPKIYLNQAVTQELAYIAK